MKSLSKTITPENDVIARGFCRRLRKMVASREVFVVYCKFDQISLPWISTLTENNSSTGILVLECFTKDCHRVRRYCMMLGPQRHGHESRQGVFSIAFWFLYGKIPLNVNIIKCFKLSSVSLINLISGPISKIIYNWVVLLDSFFFFSIQSMLIHAHIPVCTITETHEAVFALFKLVMTTDSGVRKSWAKQFLLSFCLCLPDISLPILLFSNFFF